MFLSLIWIILCLSYLLCSPEQMLPLLPVGPDRAWGPRLYTNTIKSSFIAPFIFTSLSLLPFTSSFSPLLLHTLSRPGGGLWNHIIIIGLSIRRLAASHATPHKWSLLRKCWRRYRRRKRKKSCWLNSLNVSHICACQSLLWNRRGGLMCLPLSQSWAANKLPRVTNYRSIWWHYLYDKACLLNRLWDSKHIA